MSGGVTLKKCKNCGEEFGRNWNEGHSLFTLREYCGARCRSAAGVTACAVATCPNRSSSFGLCDGHYQRMRTTGVVGGYLQGQDPDAVPRRFWSKVETSAGPDACWPWTKQLNNKGYGVFRIYFTGSKRGTKVLAHRYAFEHATGEDIAGKKLLHSCDNPPCCNPRHLRPGSQADNIHDAMAKGRHVPPPVLRGERNPLARLSEAKVREIHARLADGELQESIAAAFGIKQTTVSHIKLGKSWAHLHPDEKIRQLSRQRQAQRAKAGAE